MAASPSTPQAHTACTHSTASSSGTTPGTAQVGGARPLPLLLAATGQLSGDGQLRELIAERRERQGAQVELWYVPPAVLAALLPEHAAGTEAVVAADPAVITWLQLRFGGSLGTAVLDPQQLHNRAGGLPPRAPLAALTL
jgi:hypothetical protein